MDVRRFLAIPLLLLAAPATQGSDLDGASLGLYYKFENPRFHISLIEIELAQDGTGELRFRQGQFDDLIDLKIALLPATINRILRLLEASNFVSSNEEYQDKRDFSHLGWTTLGMRLRNAERRARFNYTTNVAIRELTNIFRGIATQEIDLFNLDLAVQHQPLDLPKRLEVIETDLRLERIAEPERLLKPLREIAGSDILPLIARNQAKRIISGVEKGKFKSPVKNESK